MTVFNTFVLIPLDSYIQRDVMAHDFPTTFNYVQLCIREARREKALKAAL